jgi:hypothetical protein
MAIFGGNDKRFAWYYVRSSEISIVVRPLDAS